MLEEASGLWLQHMLHIFSQLVGCVCIFVATLFCSPGLCINLWSPLDWNQSWKAFLHTQVQEEATHIFFSSLCGFGVPVESWTCWEFILLCSVNSEAICLSPEAPPACPVYSKAHLAPFLFPSPSLFCTELPCAPLHTVPFQLPHVPCTCNIAFSSAMGLHRLLSLLSYHLPHAKTVSLQSWHLLSTYYVWGISSGHTLPPLSTRQPQEESELSSPPLLLPRVTAG